MLMAAVIEQYVVCTCSKRRLQFMLVDLWSV